MMMLTLKMRRRMVTAHRFGQKGTRRCHTAPLLTSPCLSGCFPHPKTVTCFLDRPSSRAIYFFYFVGGRSFKIVIEIELLYMSRGHQEHPLKLVTRGSSEHFYNQVGLGFARAWWMSVIP